MFCIGMGLTVKNQFVLFCIYLFQINIKPLLSKIIRTYLHNSKLLFYVIEMQEVVLCITVNIIDLLPVFAPSESTYVHLKISGAKIQFFF